MQEPYSGLRYSTIGQLCLLPHSYPICIQYSIGQKDRQTPFIDEESKDISIRMI